MGIGAGIVLFALGAIVGSFVGVVAERAHTGQSWKSGRSRCNSCRHELAVRDLIPVLSWALNRGRCRMCSAKVGALYSLYEITMGVLFFLAYVRYGITLELGIFLSALTVLAFITVYDLRHTIVPPLAASVFIVLSTLFTVLVSPNSHALLVTFLYAGGIAVAFLLLHFLSGGRAMGLGDTPIVFGLSMLMGHAALAGVLFSFWIGGAIGIFILVFRRGGPKMGIEVPFVPFLAAGFLLALFTQWNPLPF